MPLYNVTMKPDRLVKPEKIEDYDVIQKLQKEMPYNSYFRALKTIGEAINEASEDQSKLVWVRAASLFGYQSMVANRHLKQLWDSVYKCLQDDRLTMIAVGSLLRWSIAQRSETWLLYVLTTDSHDPVTGERIKYSTYWVDDDYIGPNMKPPRSAIDGLAAAWGANVR